MLLKCRKVAHWKAKNYREIAKYSRKLLSKFLQDATKIPDFSLKHNKKLYSSLFALINLTSNCCLQMKMFSNHLFPFLENELTDSHLAICVAVLADHPV